MVHARAFYELRVVPWSVYTAVSFKVLIAVFDCWFLFSRQAGETFICVSVDRRSSCNKQTLGASFTAAWMVGEAPKDVCDACVAYGLQCRMSLQLLYFSELVGGEVAHLKESMLRHAGGQLIKVCRA